MNLTDFYFLCSFAIILLVYYIVPRKLQWGVILAGSIVFYLVSGHPVLILYPVISVCIVYVCARINKKSTLVIGIVSLIAILIILKYLKLIGFDLDSDSSFGAALILIPLGLSYYTFTLISYLVDVYNGIAETERNPLRLLCFGMYAPALVSGPIMQYRVTASGFFEEHKFSFESFTRGLQRMLWGFFKKLVIAERLNVIVATVYTDPDVYSGVYVWGAVICFTIQLYADFSGLMDIVLGISECLGIKLPENFDTPFFSKSIEELWRRWHMTLGVWMKEYVFYPVLRSRLHAGVQSALKNRLPKKAAKRTATFSAMFVLWLAVGLWHGGNLTFVIGSGLLQWLYIVLEELLEEPIGKLRDKMGIKRDAVVLQGIRIVRTFLLFSLGMAFFRSESVASAIHLLECGFKSPQLSQAGALPVIGGFISGLSADGVRVLNDTSSLGLIYADILIAVFALCVLLIVDILKTRGDVRTMIASRPLVFRFIFWLAVTLLVILLGRYGPGYDATEFIYQGF